MRKHFKVDSGPMVLYHGTDRRLLPDDFKFNRSDEDNDFGKAMYFGLSVKMAYRWAKSRKAGIVNWYLFEPRLASESGKIAMKILDDPMVWINTILAIHDKRYSERADIIAGDTMDAKTGDIMKRYDALARSMLIPTSALDDDIKRRMVDELNPDHFDQQIAFRSRKALSLVKFMGSVEVSEMDGEWIDDPDEIAADVVELLSKREDLTQNEALSRFLRSDTFCKLISDKRVSSVSPEQILEMYLSEAKT